MKSNNKLMLLSMLVAFGVFYLHSTVLAQDMSTTGNVVNQNVAKAQYDNVMPPVTTKYASSSNTWTIGMSYSLGVANTDTVNRDFGNEQTDASSDYGIGDRLEPNLAGSYNIPSGYDVGTRDMYTGKDNNGVGFNTHLPALTFTNGDPNKPEQEQINENPGGFQLVLEGLKYQF